MPEEMTPAASPAPRERRDAMKVSAQEKADLDARDVSRPYQKKKCPLCGRVFRTCSGGRINCTQCSPPTAARRLPPEVKAAIIEGHHLPGDIRDATAPVDDILKMQAELSEEALRPQNSTEALNLLARIAEHVARGRLSALKGRTLTMIVKEQLRFLEKQDARAWRERERREREARQNMRASKLEADRKKRADEKAAKAAARALEREKNGGKKPPPEVPLPELTEHDRKIAEGA